MIQTCDVGSLPLRGKLSRLEEGAKKYNTLTELLGLNSDDSDFFEESVVEGLKDKFMAGIQIPNYPQYRDMNEMFLNMISGVRHDESGYHLTGKPSLGHKGGIPEVKVIERNMSEIIDATGFEEIGLKLCVTGPYTLSSLFKDRNPEMFEDLSHCISAIVSDSCFHTNLGGVTLLSIDEPVFGFIDDPLLDYGSEGREALLKGWNDICRAASNSDVNSILHLHNTGNRLFWEVEQLDVIESHVNDPLYEKQNTRTFLEERDKYLKASISVTQFDDLIEHWLIDNGYNGNIPERIGRIWTSIRRGDIDHMKFLEDTDLMTHRLEHIVKDFGIERIPYAGPECGLSSFPYYASALETLRRASEAVARFNENHSAA